MDEVLVDRGKLKFQNEKESKAIVDTLTIEPKENYRILKKRLGSNINNYVADFQNSIETSQESLSSEKESLRPMKNFNEQDNKYKYNLHP
ncbi:hypothetical protein LguiB_007472 [Lonicera macranthoides]